MPRFTQNASENAAQQYQNSEGATNPPTNFQYQINKIHPFTP